MSIDPRLMERRKTVAEDKAKRNIGRLLKFLAIAVVVGAAVWVLFSPWLSVGQVTATGIDASDGNAILADARVTAGTPMILISVSEVESALLADPWVAEARVDLDWPDAVVVEVVERVPAAWVRTGGGWTRRAIDGVAVPSKPEPGEGMARIEMPGIADQDAETSRDLLGALEFVEALPDRWHDGTVVTRHDGELWATVSGFRVRLGRSDAMAEKALSLEALLGENIAEGSTLVMIAPTNPAVMTPSEEGSDGGDAASEATGGDEGGEENATGDTNDDS